MSFLILPSTSRLSGLVKIHEEKNLWIKGTAWHDDSVAIEISFEQGEKPNQVLPNTQVSYLGMWRPGRKGCVFEFQLGILVHRPTEEDWQNLILPIIMKLQGYRPPRVL